MVNQEDGVRVTAEHWRALCHAQEIAAQTLQNSNERLRRKNKDLAERCERLEDTIDAIRQELREASADNRAFVRTDVLKSLILQASGGKA